MIPSCLGMCRRVESGLPLAEVLAGYLCESVA